MGDSKNRTTGKKSADRDWPYAPGDPAKRNRTEKPDMEFDPGDEHPDTMISKKGI